MHVITVMHVIPELDAGNMIHHAVLPLSPEETGGRLHDRLAELGPEALAPVFRRFQAGENPAGEAQDIV